jgi:hypothetical protein
MAKVNEQPVISGTDNVYAEALQAWLGNQVLAIDGGETGPTRIIKGKLIRHTLEVPAMATHTNKGREVYAIEIPGEEMHILTEFMQGFVAIVEKPSDQGWEIEPIENDRPSDGFSMATISIEHYNQSDVGSLLWPSTQKASAHNYFPE